MKISICNEREKSKNCSQLFMNVNTQHGEMRKIPFENADCIRILASKFII